MTILQCTGQSCSRKWLVVILVLVAGCKSPTPDVIGLTEAQAYGSNSVPQWESIKLP